ncbi:helix-turn-helix transcriptional regulator [Solirubrobacter ginsenosidimutans]|uniref:Helix-turn-helix transcriptional regulator n=1 Tax=Solirubrobacter ginsenosidimutans TaxID=490573 RepID=A0A9X3RZJ2_9ACTN|nr:helix-turn-helix transcriptional regulator [Solirubrobacter ginsenosidimutans]MDA0160244.1 helix-turn-helix transcriptional regulator [Solirubrobacter ginsenosidimutans]
MSQIGPLLKTWRTKRRLSQLDLALEAGVSTRHLSFVETGRSRPSEQMVVHLAEQLDVPLRERNRMLLAAGYAPIYSQRPLNELGPVKDALDQLLKSHEPFPAIVVDRAWNVVAANAAIPMLTAGAAPHLLEPPINALRLSLHPDGMAPRIVNLGEWRAHLLRDLEAQVAASNDDELTQLLEELQALPGPEGEPAPHEVFVPLRITSPGGGELRFLSTRTTFATAVDVTVSELAIESFFPADAETAAYVASR